mmetsp:Transcript_18824/g.71252  ORF Transcript_18824/g.71252 Transcript_18824/m.71252 type:complete len:228 (+) Transcript_18824:2323-3006(+)
MVTETSCRCRSMPRCFGSPIATELTTRPLPRSSERSCAWACIEGLREQSSFRAFPPTQTLIAGWSTDLRSRCFGSVLRRQKCLKNLSRAVECRRLLRCRVVEAYRTKAREPKSAQKASRSAMPRRLFTSWQDSLRRWWLRALQRLWSDWVGRRIRTQMTCTPLPRVWRTRPLRTQWSAWMPGRLRTQANCMHLPRAWWTRPPARQRGSCAARANSTVARGVGSRSSL